MKENHIAVQDQPHDERGDKAAEWLSGGGEMGKLIRSMDWSRTPLGPIESWPQSLRTTVSLCVASNFPISIAWGPHRVQIYNDGYWPICAAKHPHSMGQDFKECWFSAWPAIGEAFDSASAGQTAFVENRRMFLDRNGYLEETFFTFSFSPIRDQTGGVCGLFHPVTELTQQTLAERRLKALRDIADSTADAQHVDEALARLARTLGEHNLDVPFALFYLVDSECRHARLVETIGIPPATGASPALLDLQLPPQPAWPLAEVARSSQSAQVDDLEDRFGPLCCGPYLESPKMAFVLPITLPGQAHPLALLVAGVSSRRPLDEPYRNFYEMLGIAVTNALSKARAYEEERKRAEALAELDRAKTAFFSNVSHEFRTPLTLMLGPVEETLADPETPSVVRKRLEVSHRNSLRLLKLVNSLLDFSRIEAGRIQASYEPTDLATFTAALASNFRSAIERAGMKLLVHCESLAEPVYVDRDMWEKIVLNLSSNAFKYTLAGEIEVTLKKLDHAAELSVRDTGIGISKHELSNIFQRFYRIEGARGRTHEGSGIGLSLVQELVKLHGGTISVDSVYGEGSTFTVRIPLGRAHLPCDRIEAGRALASSSIGSDAYVAEALRWLTREDGTGEGTLAKFDPVTEAISGASTHAARVLVADDNADMRDYVRHLLAPHYRVETVADGNAALVAARRQKPDLVLADVMMPGMDGFALLRAVREDEVLQSVPVIMLSARAGEESRVEGLKAGADDYLIKPFSARELTARVGAHLQLQHVRREAEQALRQRTEQFETLLNEAPLGVYLVDADFRIRQVNPVALAIFGDILDLIGRDFEEVIHLLWPKAYADEIVQRFRHTLETGEPYIVPERVEERLDRGVTEYYEWQINRIPLPDGRYGVVCYFRDISAQVRAREMIEESEGRFRTLADNISQFAWMADHKGCIFWYNRRWFEYTGTTLEDVQGWGWKKLHHPDHVDRVVERIQRAWDTGEEWEDTFPLRGKDGKYRWFLSRAVPIRDAEGRVLRWFGTNTDISERMALETALRQADRRKDEFLANMSHEIRSPMTGIMGYSDILLMKLQDPDDIECVKTIKESGKYLIEIIDDILDLSKIEAGKLKLHKESVSLTTLLAEIHALMEVRAKEKKLPLSLKYDGAVPETIETDRTRLRQIVVNLVSNAIKFTDQGSVQIVARFLPADLLQVDVVDTGIGISPAQQARLFQPFSQADSSSTREFGGTGLGLAITKRLVDMLDGYISFETEVGKGSAFHVIIPTGPIRGATIRPVGIGVAKDMEMETEQKLDCRVLIVDDRPEIRYLIGHFIREAGGRAVGVADGEAAIQAIRESDADGGAFDVVFMDIQMPGIDGYQVTRRLRSEGFRMPIIALTASAMKGEREKCMEAGCDDYMTKPIDRRKLIEMLADFGRK